MKLENLIIFHYFFFLNTIIKKLYNNIHSIDIIDIIDMIKIIIIYLVLDLYLGDIDGIYIRL